MTEKQTPQTFSLLECMIKDRKKGPDKTLYDIPDNNFDTEGAVVGKWGVTTFFVLTIFILLMFPHLVKVLHSLKTMDFCWKFKGFMQTQIIIITILNREHFSQIQ